MKFEFSNCEFSGHRDVPRGCEDGESENAGSYFVFLGFSQDGRVIGLEDHRCFQVGKLSAVWVAFAKFYEKNGQIQDVSSLFYSFLLVSIFCTEVLSVLVKPCKRVEYAHNERTFSGSLHLREGH